MDLDHIVSNEARHRIQLLAHLRQPNIYSEPSGAPEPQDLSSYLHDPIEHACTLARAAFELCFDFSECARLAALQGDFAAHHAYLHLAEQLGDALTCQMEYERLITVNSQ
ncbi:hypothetical protein C4580_02220 [Candidatus Woesearchaeota archaeon]|nr:MAG: hypothetical protein C4580_02220 [Candidatus Woesearchaeota archaeon]